ncbi:unnamed protein product [Rotaria sp. Silwood1]|nr:unnamed protein product [Rotaria sp. Silwood1]
MQSEYGYQSVLFEIQVDPDSTYPYANISHMSELPWEDETLFAIGSIFQIINIEYSEQEKANEMEESSDKIKEKEGQMKSEIAKQNYCGLTTNTLEAEMIEKNKKINHVNHGQQLTN